MQDLGDNEEIVLDTKVVLIYVASARLASWLIRLQNPSYSLSEDQKQRQNQ